MKTKINVLFYLRRSKVNAQGKMPIFQRITIDGKRFDTSTGHYIEETKWSADFAKIKGNSEEARLINNQLDLLRATVLETEKKLYMSNIEITYETFKNEHQGKKEKERHLIPIFEEHNRKLNHYGLKVHRFGL